MTTATAQYWYVDCHDCQHRSGPYEYKAPAHAERVMHEVSYPTHRATVFLRFPR